MRSTVLGGLVGCITKRAESSVHGEARRLALPRPYGPSSLRSDTILSAVGAPASGRLLDNAMNTFAAPAGCESRRPHGSLRHAPYEPPAMGKIRPAGLPAALSRGVAPARHAAAVFLVVVAGLLAVSTAAQAQPVFPYTYVSNSTQSQSGSAASFQAQSIMTGPNVAGYLITRIVLQLNRTVGLSTVVKIRENDASDEPGDLVATMTHSSSLTGGGAWNTFTPPPDTKLNASTTYWITVNEGIASDRVSFSRTSGHGEDYSSQWRRAGASATVVYTEVAKRMIGPVVPSNLFLLEVRWPYPRVGPASMRTNPASSQGSRISSSP